MSKLETATRNIHCEATLRPAKAYFHTDLCTMDLDTGFFGQPVPDGEKAFTVWLSGLSLIVTQTKTQRQAVVSLKQVIENAACEIVSSGKTMDECLAKPGTAA